ncbi:hypothetical protein N3930_05225, partial [Bacillus thuringiensis]|nr:hypothetical protein [Bacillus thuringiensis]
VFRDYLNLLTLWKCAYDSIICTFAAKYDNNTLVILLQNTNEAGADIVMNRLKPKMEQWLAAEAIRDIKISREQIGNKGQTLL